MVVKAPDVNNLGETITLHDPADEPEGQRLEEIADTGKIITDPGESTFGQRLLSFRNHAMEQPVELLDPSNLIKSRFGLSAKDLTDRDDWKIEMKKLEYGLLAGKFLGGKARMHIQQTGEVLLAGKAIEYVVKSEDVSSEQFIRKLNASFIIPSSMQKSARDNSETAEIERKSDFQKKKSKAFEQAKSLLISKKELNRAFDHLSTVPHSHLRTSSEEQNETIQNNENSTQSPGIVRRVFRSIGIIREDDLNTQVMQPGTPSQRDNRVMLTEEGINTIPESTMEVLTKTGIDPGKTAIEEITSRISNQQKRINNEVSMLLRPFTANTYNLAVGKQSIMLSVPNMKPSSSVMAPLYDVMNEANWHNPPDEWLPEPESGPDPRVDCTPSNLIPSGIGRLLVIRQQLVRYERRDISHVENVLEREHRTRDHNRRITTEEVFVREVETEITEERNLQSTDRFQLASESSKAINDQMESKGELSVSGKYGPTVEFEANTSVVINNSTQRSDRVAQEFAQEVIEHAVNRISERVREERTLRIVEEFEERNHHGFINESGEKIIGIYQWLEKIYEAQIYDYGQRTLYDLIVPEPAAFYIAAFQSQNGNTKARLVKPREFNVPPMSITEDKYDDYIAEYGATDVSPPPKLYTTVAHSFNSAREQEWEEARIVQSADISIPSGYEVIKGWINVQFTGNKDVKSSVDIFLGRKKHYFDFSKSSHRSFNMPSESGKIPTGLHAYKVSSVTATIELLCRRTATTMNQWRLDTHERIVTAYQQRLSEYNAEQDRLAFEVGEQIRGQSPAANRKLEAIELKRAAISLMTNGRVLYDAIDLDSDNIPFVDTTAAREAEPVIRFLEQAFEWENLNYLFYPYFWGRKEPYWKQKVLYEDVDPAFANFIKAGASKVQLAVRPGFENAVDHFMKTCEPWNGGELPTITDDTFVAFIDEQKSQLGAPGNEVPVGAPWEVRIPTNLVILKSNSDLPKWRKEGQNWVEDD